MGNAEKITVLGKELTLDDIENVKSPAIRKILKEQLFQQSREETSKGKIYWSGRFPTCGIITS